MPAQDTAPIKEKIISVLRVGGPSLPVPISGKIGNSILFTSAFLSELLSEKKIKISNMRVGNSPIYYIEGQEPQLERFSNYLKSKEKEAFLLLKEKKFLKDSVQQPAIRVALREIRDFAIPFRHGPENEIWWRYVTVNESELNPPKREIPQPEIHTQPKEKDLGIFEETEEEKQKQKIKKSKPKHSTRRKSPSSNEKLFNSVKEFMQRHSIHLKDVKSFSKGEIILIVEENGKQKVLIAFNKLKIGDKEISKASKKAKEFRLPYIIIGKSGVLKKIETLISDLQNMDSIKSLND